MLFSFLRLSAPRCLKLLKDGCSVQKEASDRLRRGDEGETEIRSRPAGDMSQRHLRKFSVGSGGCRSKVEVPAVASTNHLKLVKALLLKDSGKDFP